MIDKQACIQILTEIAGGRLDAVIDVEIVQEILYRYGAIQRRQVGVQMAESLLELAPVVLSVTPADAKAAVALFARYAPQGVTARDALHAAVMQNRDLTRIISADRHFDQIDGITRIDPLAMLG